jgi:hypothetical protein
VLLGRVSCRGDVAELLAAAFDVGDAIVTAAGADHPGSVIWSLVSLDRVAVPSADWIVHGFRKLEARPTASAFLAVARLRKPVRPVTGMMPYRESAAADGA